MNKLTEIKQSLEIREEMGRRDEDTICMRYLVALLEEKDKALAFYADIDNYDFNGRYSIPMFDDNGKIARKAFNTSSNNEGD